jgi:hypothetical protein
MRKSLIVAVLISVVATPVLADEIGVHVVPFGTGVTIGEDHNLDGDGTTTIIKIKEREPHDSATVIKKGDADANREAAVIHQDDHN